MMFGQWPPSDRQKAIARDIAQHSSAEFYALRTALDTLACWSSNEELSDLLRNSQNKPHLFNNGNLRAANRRQTLLEKFEHMSPRAKRILTDAGCSKDIPKVPPKHDDYLICDHVVPVEEFKRQFRQLETRNQLGEDEVLSLVGSLFRRCIITKAEDRRLLKSTMPPGWKPTDGPWARYTLNNSDEWAWAKSLV